MNTTLFHPMLVHFPIALLIVGFLFATIGMFCKKCRKKECEPTDKPSCIMRAGVWLLMLGTLGAIASVASGAVFTEPMEGLMGAKRELHATFAVATVIVSVLCSLVLAYGIYAKKRRCSVMIVGYVLYIVAFLLVSYTGHLGGLMVY